jgi:Putative threonine/serine exporter
MTEPSGQDAAWLDALAHLTLQLGRILLVNGSDTEQVQLSVARFATAFGAEANLLVSYEAVLLTLSAAGQIRTKIGYRVPGMGVGMSAIQAITAWWTMPPVDAFASTRSNRRWMRSSTGRRLIRNGWSRQPSVSPRRV